MALQGAFLRIVRLSAIRKVQVPVEDSAGKTYPVISRLQHLSKTFFNFLFLFMNDRNLRETIRKTGKDA